MKIHLSQKKIIISLILIILILSLIIGYLFVVKPQIQKIKVEAYNTGAIGMAVYIVNQVNQNGQVQINFGNETITLVKK